jgi:Malectin domain
MLSLRASNSLSKMHWLFVTVALLAYCLWPIAARASTAIDNGYKTISSSGESGEVTGEKPESKLWFNDGLWWGVLWDNQALSYHIFRFDLNTQDWVNTGTAVDNRTSSRSDVLWNQSNNKLYVTSHKFTTTALPDANAANRGRLYRYSYNAATKVYTLDAGFPVDVTGGQSEALTLARDSTGKLWVTYTESLTAAGPGRVMVNTTTTGSNDLLWGTPFELPFDDAKNLAVDDISAIISYNGRVGIMWSNQATSPKQQHFAAHVDGAGDTTWEGAPAHTTSSDDHINLKYVPGAGGGTLVAAVKTSRNQEIIVLLVCTNGICTSTADWASYIVYDSATWFPTRPILLVDSENSEAYVFTANSSVQDGTSANAIYYKKTSLTNIGFIAADQGTPFILSSVDTRINDPTSTKQNLTSATGLLVLGSDTAADFYYHNYLQIASSLAPDITSFDPTSGGAGTQVTLTGNKFTGSTAVAFNGTSAVFTVNSNTQITTAVPVGATTGKISVTNLGGTRSSLTNFTVLSAAPVILTGLQAFNTGGLSTTATVSCLGQTSKQQLLLPGTITTINTGWTAPCSPVSISNADLPPSGPVITNVGASSITTTGATITWTTNVLANTQVEYGPTTAYGGQTILNSALVTNHVQPLTGLAPGVPYHYRAHSTDGFANPAVSGDLTFTTLAADPPPGFNPIRVNTAGPAYTDSLGQVWSADTNFSGGTVASVGNRAIANTVDDALYQNERWGAFTYTFTVPAGSYQVTLKFSETYFTGGAASGQRLFNVAINGTTVLTNFDVKATAGGANIALDRTFAVLAGAGNNNLQIQFIHVSGQPDDPKVDAIEIVGSGG